MNLKEENQQKTKRCKKKIMKKLKKEAKGITLIALVVTIIVLLILAAVAINLTIGNNGIFTRAQNATQKWEEASKNEQDEMDKVSNFLDEYMNGNNGNQDGGSEGAEDKVTWLDDVPVPDGFYYAGGSKDTGLVISDNVADKKDYTEENKNADVSTDLQGNQFVWVPVPDPSKIFVDETVTLNGVETTTDVYSKLSTSSTGKPGETSKRREPDVLSKYDVDEKYYKTILGFNSTKEMADSMVAEYKAMSNSIKKYKGFYIGRYEITGTVDNPTEKKGPVLTADSSQAGNWYGLYKACKGFTKGNVVSTMIYGCQWDATMEWLKQTKFKDDPSKVDSNSSSWGNYSSGSKINTGSNPEYQANKIFDLAGNCRDWTQEAVSTNDRVDRRW